MAADLEPLAGDLCCTLGEDSRGAVHLPGCRRPLDDRGRLVHVEHVAVRADLLEVLPGIDRRPQRPSRARDIAGAVLATLSMVAFSAIMALVLAAWLLRA